MKYTLLHVLLQILLQILSTAGAHSLLFHPIPSDPFKITHQNVTTHLPLLTNFLFCTHMHYTTVGFLFYLEATAATLDNTLKLFNKNASSPLGPQSQHNLIIVSDVSELSCNPVNVEFLHAPAGTPKRSHEISHAVAGPPNGSYQISHAAAGATNGSNENSHAAAGTPNGSDEYSHAAAGTPSRSNENSHAAAATPNGS